MTSSIGFSLSICIGLLLCYGILFASDDSKPVEFNSRNQTVLIIDASIDQVWAAFTTNEGLKHWWAPLVNIDFKIGGVIQASYNPQGTLGDAATINNTILSYDTNRMLSYHCTKSPAGFPFANAIQEIWAVFYFDAETPQRTKITFVENGYSQSEESKQMREFFRVGNAQVFANLKKHLETKTDSQEP